MEPMQGIRPFIDVDWDFSFSCDGYRMLADFGEGAGELRSSRGLDVSDWFPEVSSTLQAMNVPRMVVDGHICVLDAAGRNDPRRLHARALRPGLEPGQPNAVFCVQDVLVFAGDDVRQLAWWRRRELLARLPMDREGTPFRLWRTLHTEGKWLACQALALGYDGVLAYRRGSSYRAGPSADWLTIRCPQRPVPA